MVPEKQEKKEGRRANKLLSMQKDEKKVKVKSKP